ncbi:MAG: ABC transporter permease [Actinobacteria bacterium]|nr:MAG: ABC transporter permease [Actinomycetota bacterium]
MSQVVTAAPTERTRPAQPRPGRIGGWLRNPWGRPRFLPMFALLYMVWSLAPVAIAVLFSFNSGRSRSAWQGFSIRWYWGDPSLSVWHDPALRSALAQSLKLASLTMLISVPLGVAFAIGLDRWRGRGSGTANFLMLFSFVTPELIMGVSLFLLFVKLFTLVRLGTTAQLLGLITFEIAYPVIIVRARLLSIGKEYEEAAMDLGASPTKALRMVLLPLLLPAIFASFALVFADSIDDFIIVRYLSAGAATETIPVKIYSTARGSPTPALNALASIMLFSTVIAVTLALIVYRSLTRGERKGEGMALRDFAAQI